MLNVFASSKSTNRHSEGFNQQSEIMKRKVSGVSNNVFVNQGKKF